MKAIRRYQAGKGKFKDVAPWMKTKVRVETQVEEFLKALAPDPRRRLRLAIRALADDSGDV